ncbi:MAG: hypothetical protein IKU30_05770 [Clostridia bacterium]|nr:hypothetical protein [Clostridia bacterium]
MKQINIKKLMDVYHAECTAEIDLAHCRKHLGDYYWITEKTVTDAEAKYDALHQARVNMREYQALVAAIKDAEGRAKERTITADNVLDWLDDIFKKIDISKKAMDGVTVNVDIHAEALPGAYKWTAYSTQFTAIFKSGGWRVTGISRSALRRKNRVIVHHTEESKKALIDKWTNLY